jgi:Zn-dependent M28 family amino/carboxypeptidase
MALQSMRARLAVSRRSEPVKIQARNVAGFLEGSDPALKDEWILVGGHHDHIGSYTGPGDTIFNGADDNASGTSGVLELAEAFASLERRPRRSLVFVTFSAEEVGLLGSRAVVEQQKLPLERFVFMLNFDMIGRNPGRAVEVFSSAGSRFSEEVKRANQSFDLLIEISGVPSDAYSDYFPFYRKGIPFAYFFTGLHEDYHQTDDHADRLDYRRIQRIVRLAYTALFALADGDGPDAGD